MKLIPILAACLGLALTASAADSTVVFNEIQYNPAAGQEEFIELRNLNGVDVSIAGWRIDGGVDYIFPAGTIIPGGGYRLIGAVPGAIGEFNGQLDNGGETLRLRNLNGRIMDEVTYDDGGEWPAGADGSGASLSRRNASAAEGPAAWAASTALGGTPGAENFAVVGPVNRTLIANRASWKYLDADAEPPPDWLQSAFNDTAWAQGNAALGTPGGGPPALSVTADLVERFRASAITGVVDGAVVANWIDGATGDGVSQNAAAGTTTPTFRVNATPSGKAAVRFDGNDESRTAVAPGIAPTAGFVYFIVLKGNGAQTNGAVTDGGGNYIFDRSVGGNPLVSLKAVNGSYGLQKRFNDGSGLGGPVATTPISTTAFQIVAARRNRTQNRFELWVNGVMEATDADAGSALTPDPIDIGRHATGATQGFIGDIAELLIYKSELSDADFQAVGAYLETEYGLDTAFPGNLIATPLSATAPTSYFRKTFTSPGNAALTTLRLTHTVADGAVFYLNGSEIVRANMPGGAVTHTTAASSIVTTPASSGAIVVPAASLVNGTNVLAVSLHKAVASPGVFFEAALESTEAPPDANADQLRFNEIAAAGDAAFYVELRNNSANSISTAGWSIIASNGQGVALAAQSIAAGGFLALNVADLGFSPGSGTRLFLRGPGGAELRDTQTVSSQLRGTLPDGRWGHPDSATPGAANVVTISTAIVINEIFYHAPGASLEQWIELHNRSGGDVNIGLWKLSDGVSYDFPANTMIPAGGFLVVAWNPASFAALHPGVTALGPFGGSLSGRGETITLRDANDNVANQVTYSDGGRWSQWADGGGSSLELIDPHGDNTKGEAWDGSDESSRSTWQNVSISGTAALNPANNPTTWNEFLFGLLNAGEFLIDDISVKNVTLGNVELIQNGTFGGGNANFWRIIGTHRGTVVPDPTAPANNVLKVTATAETEHMHNHAGTTLKNGASFHTIVASHTYNISFRAKWLRGSNLLHSRLYVNILPLKTTLNRPATGGTPGAPNSRFAANVGPTFDALAHSPVVPPAALAATVSVKVADPDGIASVQLFTSVNGAAFTSTAMSTAGGGIYTGTVPGQSAGAVVQFYVRATDTPGAISFFPAGGPASRAMIPWDDGRAQLTLASGAKPHNIRVIMPGVDANDLYKHENLMSNAAIPCTVIYDEREVYYRAGVALKSSEHGRFNVGRVGYNIEFPPDDLFLGTHGGISIDRSGGVVTGQKEILLKTLSNLAGGVHAPEDDIIRLIPAKATGTGFAFDGSGMLGAAILSKTRLKGDYLDNQWDNGGDGMMFKYERIYVLTQTINPATRIVDAAIVPENPKIPQDSTSPPGVAVTNLGANPEFYRWHWLVESGRDTDDYTGMMNVATAVGQVGGSAAFNTQTAQYIDVDEWLRAHVPAVLYGVVDNYMAPGGSGQHNALIFFPPGKKAVIFPWDMDFLSQANPTTTSLTGGGDISKFIANPVWKRLYYGHMLDILNRSFNTVTMTQWATHYSRFGTDDMIGSVSAYLTPRAQYARDVVTGTNGQSAPIPFVVFARTSTSPVTVSTPFATVSGVGWINLATIRLLGSAEPLAVTWTGQNAWTLQLPIFAGTNTYILVPYDRNGVQLGNTATGGTPVTTSVTITGSGGTFAAGPGNLVVSELNYNPPGSTDATEFIELLNITGATLDLSGCHFDEEGGQGIAYTFANGVQVPAGGRIIVARDRAAFLAAYPGAGPLAAGEYNPSGLDNSGESLVLYSAGGVPIFRFTYNDNIASTDGGGRSLVRVLSSTNPNPETYFWRASTQNNGNPGTSDAIAFAGSPLADNDGDGFARLVEYAFGTSDSDPASQPAPAQFVFDVGGNVTVTFPILPNADDAICTTETTTTLGTGWVPLTGPIAAGGSRFFRLSVTLR